MGGKELWIPQTCGTEYREALVWGSLLSFIAPPRLEWHLHMSRWSAYVCSYFCKLSLHALQS